MRHTCHAFECDAVVPQRMFMCKRHWFSLSKRSRDLIWRYYRPGQEEGGGITDEYAEHAKLCVREAASVEGKTVPDDALELTLYDAIVRSE